MDPVPTQYIDRDGAALAYQVVGDGPVDIVHSLEISQHLDLMWTDPDIHYNFEHVSRVARNVLFQRRGIGLSDQVPYVPTLEQQADDVVAVMDAVGMRRATLVAWFTTCGAMALVAARAPERVDNLVLVEPLAQGPEGVWRAAWLDTRRSAKGRRDPPARDRQLGIKSADGCVRPSHGHSVQVGRQPS